LFKFDFKILSCFVTHDESFCWIPLHEADECNYQFWCDEPVMCKNLPYLVMYTKHFHIMCSPGMILWILNGNSFVTFLIYCNTWTDWKKKNEILNKKAAMYTSHGIFLEVLIIQLYPWFWVIHHSLSRFRDKAIP